MFIRKYINQGNLFILLIVFYAVGLASHGIYRNYEGFEPRQIVMSSDMEGYYQYLPYFFLKDKEELKRMRWAKPYEEGKRLNVFTCGVAIMQSPFFLLAHVYSKAYGLQADGYAPAYFNSVLLATLFYVFLGLFFLFKALIRYFEKRFALLTSLLIFFASNLFYYTIISPGMSHAYSFCLVSIFIFLVPVFYDSPSIKNAIYIALPFSLAVLIRPTTIVLSIYFILYGVRNIDLFKERIKLLFNKWYLILIMGVIGLVVFLPQMLYWHLVTGKYIVYSYQEEGFINILSPYISTVLIGVRNGLFLYTPIMLLATGSLFYLIFSQRKYSAIAIVLLMCIIVYLDGSWWRPTFSGAAGYRALIEYYPIMAIPLAFLVQKVLQYKNRFLTGTFYTILVLLTIYNILFCYKYSHWLWWNTEWQWSHFLRLIKF